MMKQYVEGVQKWKKAYLTSVCNIAIWLYCLLLRLETTSILFKEQGQEVENLFLNFYVTPYETISYDTVMKWMSYI